MHDDLLLTVTDVKQMDYCARVTFYEHCLPHVRPRTYKMDAGHAEHEAERKRSARRNLSAYGLPEGRRTFDVLINSPQLGLIGLLDEVITLPDGRRIPVDYKLTKKASRNYQLQIAAYALLLESDGAPTVQQGYLYLIPAKKLITVAISASLRESVMERLSQIREMITYERMPPPTEVNTRCQDCEFRRFCNDV